MIRSYHNNFGKSKSAMEHWKLHGKLSEYGVLAIQTVNTAFYGKWEIASCNIQRRQPFKQKNWNNKHLQTQK